MGDRITAAQSVASRSRKPGGGTQSIRRAVDILRQVATYGRGGVRLVDVTRGLKLERSTAHRMLQCLASEGLIAQKRPDRRYVLGPLAFELGLGAARREELRALCRPVLERIARQSGDVVFLLVRSGCETVCIDRAEGNYPVRAYTRQIGDRRPMGFGAVGISMLAIMPDEEVGRILSRSARALKNFSNETIADARARVSAARRRGHATHERPALGLRAIALPIRGENGQPVAAISLTAVAGRLKEPRAAEMVALVRRETETIERAIRAKPRAWSDRLA